jgi:hypothetical protein
MKLDVRLMSEEKISKVAREIAPFFLLAGLLAWTIWMVIDRVSYGSLGIYDSLSMLYYLADALIMMAIIFFVVGNRVGWLCYLSVIILFASLYSLPWLIEGTPFFSATFRVLGYENFINDIGVYNQVALPYMNWPGIMLVGAFLKNFFAVDSIAILYIYPIIAKSLQILLAYYIILFMTKDRRAAIIGVTLFIVFDWTPYYLFLAPSLGLIFFLAIVLILCIRQTSDSRGPAWVLMLILLMGGLIITHLLSTVLVLGIISSMYILEYFPLSKFRAKSKDTVTIGSLVLFFVMFISYSVFVNNVYLTRSLPAYLSSIGDLFRVFGTAGDVGSGSSSYSEVIFFKFLFSAIIGLVLLAAFLYAWKKTGRIKEFDVLFPFVVIFMGAVIPIVIFSLYSFESITRSFAYIVPFVALVAVYNYKKKAFIAIIIIVMLVSPALFIMSAYGNMDKDFVSREEINGTNFFYDHMDKEKSLLYSNSERLILMYKIQEYRYRNSVIDIDGSTNWYNLTYPTYVLLSDRAIETAVYSGEEVNITQYHQLLYGMKDAKVYESSGFDLWWVSRAKTTSL